MSGLITIIIIFCIIGFVFKLAFSAIGFAFKLVFWILGLVFSIIGYIVGFGFLTVLGFVIVGIPIFIFAGKRY